MTISCDIKWHGVHNPKRLITHLKRYTITYHFQVIIVSPAPQKGTKELFL